MNGGEKVFVILIYIVCIFLSTVSTILFIEGTYIILGVILLSISILLFILNIFNEKYKR